MPGRHQAKQFGRIVERFKDECSSDVWDEILIAYAILMEKGPLCGPLVAKKLKNGNGIWELIAHYDNLQPRLLFYFGSPGEVVFVHAFFKKGNKDYVGAIALAQQRRRSILKGEKELHEFPTTAPNVH